MPHTPQHQKPFTSFLTNGTQSFEQPKKNFNNQGGNPSNFTSNANLSNPYTNNSFSAPS